MINTRSGACGSSNALFNTIENQINKSAFKSNFPGLSFGRACSAGDQVSKEGLFLLSPPGRDSDVAHQSAISAVALFSLQLTHQGMQRALNHILDSQIAQIKNQSPLLSGLTSTGEEIVFSSDNNDNVSSAFGINLNSFLDVVHLSVKEQLLLYQTTPSDSRGMLYTERAQQTTATTIQPSVDVPGMVQTILNYLPYEIMLKPDGSLTMRIEYDRPALIDDALVFTGGITLDQINASDQLKTLWIKVRTGSDDLRCGSKAVLTVRSREGLALFSKVLTATCGSQPCTFAGETSTPWLRIDAPSNILVEDVGSLELGFSSGNGCGQIFTSGDNWKISDLYVVADATQQGGTDIRRRILITQEFGSPVAMSDGSKWDCYLEPGFPRTHQCQSCGSFQQACCSHPAGDQVVNSCNSSALTCLDSGRCGCTTTCRQGCSDLTSDSDNCGKCGHACDGGQVCRRSSCVTLTCPRPGDILCGCGTCAPPDGCTTVCP